MSYDIGDGYYVDDSGNIQQYANDTQTYTTDGYTDTASTDTSSGGFNLSDIGKLLSGTSSYGMAGQLAGLAGIGTLLNKVLGSGSGGFAGYQGGIPQYTASRTMNQIPQTVSVPVTKENPTGIAARRPGSGGITYFTPMTYTKAPVAAAPATAGTTTTPTNTDATVTPPATVTREDGSVVPAASGGLMGYAVGGGISSLGGYSDGGQLLRGPGDGVSDDIPATIGGRQPARLADGEFVVPARIVSELGNGSTDAGARKLYAMMDRIKATRAKAKNIAANTKADKHLPA